MLTRTFAMSFTRIWRSWANCHDKHCFSTAAPSGAPCNGSHACLRPTGCARTLDPLRRARVPTHTPGNEHPHEVCGHLFAASSPRQ
ncbi:hypothetical protein OH77DRAFT_734228 [Trametes cingulata]|nr:hypothetical protein OH77DRAFT_734228 [Trametes cingulata]